MKIQKGNLEKNYGKSAKLITLKGGLGKNKGMRKEKKGK